MDVAKFLGQENAHAGQLLLRRISLSVEDLFELPKGATRLELIDGGLLMTPGPLSSHQQAVLHLTFLLQAAAPDEWDATQASYLQLGPSTVLQPDVMVVTRVEGLANFTPAEVLLVAEIVTPESRRLDQVLKPQLCAEAGIPTLMHVELEGPEAPTAIIYQLEDGAYVEHSRATAGQTLHLTQPVEVSFDPMELLSDRLPRRRTSG